MNRPMKRKPRVPPVEQAINATKRDRKSTWEALAAKISIESSEYETSCKEHLSEEKNSDEK